MRTRSQGSPAQENALVIETTQEDRDGGSNTAESKEDHIVDSTGVGATRARQAPTPGTTVKRRSFDNSETWTPPPENVCDETRPLLDKKVSEGVASEEMDINGARRKRAHLPNPWSCSILTFATTAIAALLALTIVRAFLTRQLDPRGCAMSYMRPSFAKFSDFDTEHTRFASKYSLYLYREGGVDEDTRVKGIPVLFIPGNAGSYKQVRPFAAEAAVYFQESIAGDEVALKNGKRTLDWFSVDFNEDITAFHGQTLLDQAEYLNEAVVYILALYHNPTRSLRDAELPDPTSVILVGHSMGGIVARTMLVMPNYQANTINTILTLAAPHARAPVSFDAEIVRTYKKINDYWRDSYSQKWANDNPLWHVTLVSIAGGGLDTVVPSDYSTLESLVPPTHGFTVFTSTIPYVWTGMDHLAITWCDQLRKSLVRALYDVVDAGRQSQTRPRSERMRSFKKRFLTGMEDVVERTLGQKDPKTLLILDENDHSIISQGERLTLRKLGDAKRSKAHLLPIPPQELPDGKRFTLLTDQKIDALGEHGSLQVLFCSVFPVQAGQSSITFSKSIDLSGQGQSTTRLACSSAASDAIILPASTQDSIYPFDKAIPFSYLQYSLCDLSDYQFVAVIDKSIEPTRGWVIAEFSSLSDSVIRRTNDLRDLLWNGLNVVAGPDRPMMTEITIPSVHSSLLSYKLSIAKESSGEQEELFMPMLRQSISEPYESKFFVNVREADVSLHGVAPYMPPPMRVHKEIDGLYLQFWTDPTCNNTMEISMKIDYVGSLGKLWMRYRTVFAAFPLLVAALVLRKQFTVYDSTGIFISFSESMDKCIRRSIPCLLLALTILAVSYARASAAPPTLSSNGLFAWGGNVTASPIDYTKNDLLLGSQDSFFWFLVPLFGIISVGICISLNYLVLIITHACSITFTRISQVISRRAETKIMTTFATASLRKRVLTTIILILLAATIIPYQFEFVVLCIVQLCTCVRALSVARETHTPAAQNFSHYTHTTLVLLLWILPINAPVLAVWARNLAVHWLTPFAPIPNVASILPFVLLIETHSAGVMVPRAARAMRHMTNVLFFALALYAAVYGVTFAYRLHGIVNIVCAWLCVVHFSGRWVGGGKGGARGEVVRMVADDGSVGGRTAKVKKRP